MQDIIKVIIKGESGYGCINEAYSDKLTITESSISYEYNTKIESELNIARKWSYRTSNPIFKTFYKKITEAMPEILNPEVVCYCTDVGGIEFVVTFSNKSKKSRRYFCTGDEFKDCFKLIKQIVPQFEYIPAVLMTSDDNRDE